MLIVRRRRPITARDDTWLIRRVRGDDADNTKNQGSDGEQNSHLQNPPTEAAYGAAGIDISFSIVRASSIYSKLSRSNAVRPQPSRVVESHMQNRAFCRRHGALSGRSASEQSVHASSSQKRMLPRVTPRTTACGGPGRCHAEPEGTFGHWAEGISKKKMYISGCLRTALKYHRIFTCHYGKSPGPITLIIFIFQTDPLPGDGARPHGEERHQARLEP